MPLIRPELPEAEEQQLSKRLGELQTKMLADEDEYKEIEHKLGYHDGIENQCTCNKEGCLAEREYGRNLYYEAR